jgi:glycolate oxidase FAD binding subunit
METLIDDWRARIAAAAGSGGKLAIRGGGSKCFYGGPETGERLDVAAYSGIVAYEPTELVVTARAGTGAARTGGNARREGAGPGLRAAAFRAGGDGRRHARQRFVGTTPAGGGCGARFRARRQTAEWQLGEVLSFGGQVMKNVAGYDVPRLLAGSLGTLGVVLEVSLKVLPLPVAEKSLRFALDEAAALQKLNQWGGRPLPISASAWHDGLLTLRLSGAAAAVAAAERDARRRGAGRCRRLLGFAARAEAGVLRSAMRRCGGFRCLRSRRRRRSGRR